MPARDRSSASDQETAEGGATMAVIEVSQHVDARGLSCPMPIVKTAQAIAGIDPIPETAPEAEPAAAKDFLIIDYSGDLEKVWATLILATTGAAMGVKTRVFVTFWGLQVFVKDSKRITGETWMQKML